MHPNDIIAWQELPVIQKIIADETWLEGERRGCAIGTYDPIVTEKVCAVVLSIGRQLREALSDARAA